MKKEYLVGIVLLVIIVACFLIFRNDRAYINVLGDTSVSIYVGDEYLDAGYEISSSKPDNYYVNIENKVNSYEEGKYEVIYALYNLNDKLVDTKKREVIVLPYPIDDVKLSLNGNSVEYYFVGTYQDRGAVASYNNLDITNNILVKDLVKQDIVGVYEVTYSIVKGSLSKEIKREVHIVDFDIVEDVDLSNKLIKLTINNQNYIYTLLPNNSKVENKVVSYQYDSITDYNFDIYLSNGSHKLYNVNLTKMDIAGPKGTCVATFINNNMLEINVSATDESGIKKYSYNGKDYYDKTFTFANVISKPIIKVYDNYNNETSITCSKVYGKDFKKIVSSSEKNGYTPCGVNVSASNLELETIINSYGTKTRSAVAAAALYLANYKYSIAYRWGGKYLQKGLDPNWGCATKTSRSSSGNLVCSKVMGTDTCAGGLDCTGYTSWAFFQAGFDKSIIRTSSQSTGDWGNFNASMHKYAFSSANLNYAKEIKPGDIVWRGGEFTNHVGIVIGVDDDTIEIANMLGPIIVQVNSKTTGKTIGSTQKAFTHFVLFDEFYKMYGSNT